MIDAILTGLLLWDVASSKYSIPLVGLWRRWSDWWIDWTLRHEEHGIDMAGNVALLVDLDDAREMKRLAENVIEELEADGG